MKRFIAIAIFAALLTGGCSSMPPKEEPFTVNIDSPRYTAGSAEIYFDKYLSVGGLRKNENITVYYYPGENAVCLSFKIDFAECNQFWDQAGREAFIKAFEQYKTDYEQRNLAKASKQKAGQVYGSTQGFFMWKKTKLALQAHGSPKVTFGYYLKDKAAFFSTAQMESYYEDSITRSRNQTSPIIRMYYTRAQAEALITLFNQDYLRSLNAFQSGPPSVPETDTYAEGE